jgi:hypothetical protein
MESIDLIWFSQMFQVQSLTYSVDPTAALAATTTSYVNGDILWEKYTNGYGLYKFNNGTWTLEVSGLEVGRIQDSADFQATLGPGVDGYYVIYDHDILQNLLYLQLSTNRNNFTVCLLFVKM